MARTVSTDHKGKDVVLVRIKDIDLSIRGGIKVKVRETWHIVPWIYLSMLDKEFISFLKRKHKGCLRFEKMKEEFFIYENKIRISQSWRKLKDVL